MTQPLPSAIPYPDQLEHIKENMNKLGGVQPGTMKAFSALHREACLPGVLDTKTKEGIYTAILTAVKASVNHVKSHIKLALDYGVAKQEILEALEICIPGVSVPAFMIDVEAWKQMVSPDRVEPSKP